MNEKIITVNKRCIVTIVIAAIIICAIGAITGIFITRSHIGNNGRIGSDFSRERELIERIGEFERRETERIAAENLRIRRERERIEATEIAIGTVRQLDRRTTTLLEQLAAEIDILANFFWDTWDILNNNDNNLGSEQLETDAVGIE